MVINGNRTEMGGKCFDRYPNLYYEWYKNGSSAIDTKIEKKNPN